MSKPTLPEHERRAMGARLKQARARLFRTQSEAAKILGINLSTLKGYEVGTRAISRDNILMLAKALRVSPAWLEWGSGSMTDEVEIVGVRTVPVAGFVAAGGSIEPNGQDVPKEGLASVEIPFPLPEGEGYMAFQVQGDGMMPAYRNKDVLIARSAADHPVDGYVGSLAVVRAHDGRRYLKVIRLGRRPDRYTLQSFNAVDVEDVRVAAVYPIVCWLPAEQVMIGPAEEPRGQSRRRQPPARRGSLQALHA